MMSTAYRLILVLIILCKFSCCQKLGDVCSLRSSGHPGICKLFSDCTQAREELQGHYTSPQTCGFQGSQEIVCCPERQPGEMSKKKCKEYAQYIFEKTMAPIMVIDAPEIITNECGHNVLPMIVGGKLAERKEFPHMAAVGYESEPGNIEWLCAGTIISEHYILTAAHCLIHQQLGNATWVKLGVTDLMDTNHEQVIKIKQRIRHDNYTSRSHYHDIALLKLEKAVTLNPYAMPACLYLEPEVSSEKAIATGWGRTSYFGPPSNDLLKVTLYMFNHSYCNSSYARSKRRKLQRGILKDIQVCAGSDLEEKDTCMGDSGGPLQIYHIGDDVECMYDIIGVTSFGKGCVGGAGVYTRVSHYIKWIEDYVWPQDTYK